MVRIPAAVDQMKSTRKRGIKCLRSAPRDRVVEKIMERGMGTKRAWSEGCESLRLSKRLRDIEPDEEDRNEPEVEDRNSNRVDCNDEKRDDSRVRVMRTMKKQLGVKTSMTRQFSRSVEPSTY